MDELRKSLIKDLEIAGVNTEGFEIKLRPFSATYYGRYKVSSKTVIVYVYEDREHTKLIPYTALFKTALHESIHHIQWSDPNYTRCKGIMHNSEFHKLYRRYLGRYYRRCAERRMKLGKNR